jgi:outer membrane protein assembly factor BamB
VKDHGLFRRVDGPNARWEWAPIKEWEDPNQPGRSLRTAQLRGMTAIPAPDGNGEVLLYAWDSRDAVIERIDPRASFKMTAELDVRDYFQKAWGRRVGIGTFAYNDMLPVTHPDTGEKAHLIGLWLVDPNGEGNEIGRSSWYLVRYPDGTYRYQRIWDGKNPLTDARYGLRGCRSIRPSPFPEEAGRVWYFSGFDQTGAPGGPGARGATAWVYKGTLPATPGPAARPSASSPPVSAPANVARGPASTRPAEMDANYPQFRGPRGDGVAYGTNLPVTWSTTNNVVWSCPIPGKGWSSPVVWGNRVFVTSAAGPGKVEPPPQPRGLAAHVRGVTSAEEQQYMVLCVDWSTGKPLWSRCVHKGVPPRPIHPKNSYATETPATDGERVYAYFGNIGLFCCDMEGRELWSRRWGDFDMNWNWGPAASPVLHGDLVLVLNDNKERSFLAALDKRTGKDVWRVDRDEKSNWTTPFVWRNDVRVEIVTSGSAKVRSYGLDGKALWELRGMSGVTVPTPFAADGLLYVASGCAHSPQRPVYAIRPGASGDITLKAEAANSEFIAWRQRLAAPYVPSPLVYDKLLYVLLDHGSLAAFDARTGQEVYGPQRLAAGRASFSASPWAYDGRLFCLSDTGETHVVRAGPEFRVLHVNRLEEAAYATPAVARDSLIFRTLTRLYRIAHTTEGKRP